MKGEKNKSSDTLLLVAVFISGAGMLSLEIVGARMLAPFFGSTIFVWSSLITVALGGLSLGYWIGAKLSRNAHTHLLFYFVLFASGFLYVLTPSFLSLVAYITNGLGLRFGPLAASTLLFLPLFVLGGVGSPLAVEIAATHHRAGFAAGKLYMIGTTGSLVGALLAGFFLIPLVSISNILLFTGLGLMLVSLAGIFLCKPEHKNFFAIVALVVLGTTYLLQTPKTKLATNSWIRVLAQKETFYSSLRVIEMGGYRCLLSGIAPQSCIEKADENSLGAYQPAHVAGPFFEKLTPGQNVLMLGGGSGATLRAAQEGTFATIVEIDPAVMEVAKKYFSFTLRPGWEIVTDDARHAISRFRKEGRLYDFVVVDVFSVASFPLHLVSQEAFADLSAITKPEGVVLINAGVVGEIPKNTDRYFGAIRASAESSFKNISFFWGNKSPLSNVFILLSQEDSPRLDLPELAINSGRILTDNFNPVEYYNINSAVSTLAFLSKNFSWIAQ